MRAQPDHGYALRLRMPHLQSLVLGPPVGHQQVVDALVVDLQDGNANDGLIGLTPFGRNTEQLAQRPDVHPRVCGLPLHGVRLARARLAVGEDGDVVAVHDGRDQRLDLFEHHHLILLRLERALVAEHLLVAPPLPDGDLLLPNREARGPPVSSGPVCLLTLQQRAHAAVHADIAPQVHQLVMKLLAEGDLLGVQPLHLLHGSGVLRIHEVTHLLQHFLHHHR
mmetsp:Transcript_7062/g.12215  ORF Transcript_7062/g.12215 Transcript_7062/m.12215 type:complete len:223 (-) Transcript_7062:427-1095(-)